MSNPDSFIDEVSEALRRDQMTRALRRWWWVGALVVVVIVGGAAIYEWRASRDRAEAEALGAAMLTAMDEPDPAARVSALEGLTPSGPAAAVVEMLAAAEELAADAPDEAAARLEAIAASPDMPAPYGDLAAFKAAMLRVGELPEHELRQRFEGLATPGSPFRLLAEEQIALSELRDDQRDDAVARLSRIGEDAEATSAQQNRIDALLVALGAGSAPEAETAGEALSEELAADAPAGELIVEDEAAPAVDDSDIVELPPVEEPVTEATLEEAPAADADVPLAEDAAPDATVVEEAPVEDAPAEDVTVTETPVEDAPVTEEPVTEAPATDVPAEASAVEVAPVEDEADAETDTDVIVITPESEPELLTEPDGGADGADVAVDEAD
ncbi:hypothetical protein [Pseudoroseicyclus tamaricis]|uniref:hypothetical protein n=1 Tax=Pseudoroseicyclus tamaricis TaxID=2705421 RepID=UPI00193F08D4|nr:hypothetical protein [Pseudoroseicyclus tamaricis]